jgi:uncharacterized Zn finger protein
MAGFGQLDLWRLAGKRSYERGEGYVDAVSDLRDVPGGVTATVQGTEPYQVRLAWSADGLTGECSCPFSQDEGEFCKHCVAVGLVIIDADDELAADDDEALSGMAGDDGEVSRYLASLDHGALVDLLSERAAHDPELGRMLRLRAARDTAAGRGR